MTATAAVSISWFYSCTYRRHLLSIPVLKFTSPRFPLSSAVYHFTDQLSVAYVQHRRNLLKLTAAMTQGEVETDTEVAQAEAMAPLQNTKLYFGNLPYNCDSEQLAGVIQEHASPEMIEVLYDKETGRSRGFAVVTMSSIQDCKVVISNLNGFQYDGRTLRVKFSDKSKPPRVPVYVESELKLFVGNLCWSVTSEGLKQVFKDYGNLVSARVIYDGESGRSRGFGFVCFSTKEEMDSAMESLNGVRSTLLSQTLIILISKNFSSSEAVEESLFAYGFSFGAARFSSVPNPPPLLSYLLSIGASAPPNPASRPLISGDLSHALISGKSRGYPTVRT